VICRKFAENYSCVSYYEKENGGVSSARNLGLDHAIGEYVLFVDSDDYVGDSYFDRIDRAMKENSPNLLLFGNCSLEMPERSMNCHCFFIADATHSSEVVSDLMIKGQFNALWNKCFSNAIIQSNNLRFDEAIEIAEDLHFIFSYMMYVVSVKAIPETLYYVDESNRGSLSRKNRPNLGEQLMHASLSMKALLECADLQKTAKKHYARAISHLYYRSVYSAAKELNKGTATPKDRRKQLREICNEYAGQRVPALGIKNKLIAAPVCFRMVHVIDRMARG
jgi:glycosyltransferase involved in cell wall biosynthesis